MPVELDRWRAANAPDILGSSPELTSALDFARRVGATSSAVLITGETGTGKEVFARDHPPLVRAPAPARSSP
jgi:transcriptional regulator with PAS, ATPase and Fis domain